MPMVNYQLYVAAINTTVTLPFTAKGKIVAIAWNVAMVGGAAVGLNGFTLVKNSTPSIPGSWAINNPQKQLIIHNASFESGVTAATNEHDVISGIAIDYQSGENLNLLLLNNGGTVPTSIVCIINVYCME